MDTVDARLARLEQENAELARELEIQRRLYAVLVEDQRELICRIALDGTLTFVNDAYARYFGKTREDLLGKHFTPLIPPEDHPIIDDLLARLGAKEPQVRCEHRVFAPDGALRWLNWVDRAILDDNGAVVEFQAVGIDVTDRRQAEEHLRRTDELREQLIHAQDEALRELAAPIIPVADGVLVIPLVGRIDARRAQLVLESLLDGVKAMGAETVLLDVTGIPSIDVEVAESLVRTARAVELIGARVVLTGLQPHVANTLVSMAIEIRGILTLRSLKEGIAWAMQRTRNKRQPR